MKTETIRSILERKIRRATPQFERLKAKEKDLSIWGYEEMGFFKGIIHACEDLLDALDEGVEKE